MSAAEMQQVESTTNFTAAEKRLDVTSKHLTLMIDVLKHETVESDGSAEFGDLVKHGWVKKAADATFKLSMYGRYEFITHLKANFDEFKDQISFIIIELAERIGNGELENNPLTVHGEDLLELTRKLIVSKGFDISERSREYDYAVIDFTDPNTDQKYLLFPGDLIVFNDGLYIVHQFGE